MRTCLARRQMRSKSFRANVQNLLILSFYVLQVVLVKDVETTLCSSYERWVAFETAMGSGGGADADGEAASGLVRRPFVLLGGCSLGDTATQGTQSARSDAYSQRRACGLVEDTSIACAMNMKEKASKGR